MLGTHEAGKPVQVEAESIGYAAPPVKLGLRHGSVALPAMTTVIPVRDRHLPSTRSFYSGGPTALLLPLDLTPPKVYFVPTWYLLVLEAVFPSLWLFGKRGSRRQAFGVMQTSRS